MRILAQTKKLLTTAKDKLANPKTLVIISTATMMMSTMPAFCDLNANSSMQGIIEMLFKICTFVGVVLCIFGGAMIAKSAAPMISGDQGDSHGLKTGIGLFVGGLLLAMLKTLLTTILGADPTTMTFV